MGHVFRMPAASGPQAGKSGSLHDGQIQPTPCFVKTVSGIVQQVPWYHRRQSLEQLAGLAPHSAMTWPLTNGSWQVQ